MTENELAYAAGLFDGEGCIGIYKRKMADCKVGYHYALQVRINMADNIILAWLHLHFGGSLIHDKPRKSNWKSMTSWALWANGAVKFLKLILPYLKLKKEQAKIAIEFQEAKTAGLGKYGASSGQTKPFVLIEAEAILVKQMAILNKRGTD